MLEKPRGPGKGKGSPRRGTAGNLLPGGSRRSQVVALQHLVATKWNLYVKIRREVAWGTPVMTLSELTAN